MTPNLQPVFRMHCVWCHKETLSHGGPAKACYFCKGPVVPADGVAIPPATLPESMSRDEMLRYYSEYANMVAHEVLGYQKRIRDLEAALMAAGVPDPRGVSVAGYQSESHQTPIHSPMDYEGEG